MNNQELNEATIFSARSYELWHIIRILKKEASNYRFRDKPCAAKAFDSAIKYLVKRKNKVNESLDRHYKRAYKKKIINKR